MPRKQVFAFAIFFAFLAIVLESSAQQKSLADIARETRAKRAGSAPGKVYSNEASVAPAAAPVTAADAPVAVVQRAARALLQDRDHSCYTSSAGNSGPGWAKEEVLEIFGERARIVATESRPEMKRTEIILDGQDLYRRQADSPWMKTSGDAARAYAERYLPAMMISDPLKFGYDSKLQLVGKEAVEGAPAFHYQYHIVRQGNIGLQRTIDVWIREDALPVKTRMWTSDRMSSDPGMAPLEWEQTTTCAFGTAPVIKPPLS